MTTITADGRRIRSNIVTGVVMFVLVMIAILIASFFADDSAVSGPEGSSFVTTSLGSAALAETLTTLGATVTQSRLPLVDTNLSGVDTLFALGVGGEAYANVEVETIVTSVQSGMTLIMSGPPNATLLDELTGHTVDWAPSTVATGNSVIGGDVVAAGRFGVFRPGPGLPLVTAEDNDLVVVFSVGDGFVYLFSDIAILANRNLGSADNAEYIVSVAGIGNVMFDEFRHGFTEAGSSGLGEAIPENWGNALLLLLAVTIVGLVVYGRRIGPPEPEGRSFVPPRDQLIRSIGVSLRRTDLLLEATEVVRAEAKRRIRHKGILSGNATENELRTQAALLLPPDEVAAVFDPTPDTVLLADRAVARLSTIDGDLT